MFLLLALGNGRLLIAINRQNESKNGFRNKLFLFWNCCQSFFPCIVMMVAPLVYFVLEQNLESHVVPHGFKLNKNRGDG